ncbi:MAG TPA: DMSO reductase, partial [Dehalococcoidia bacterium]|nr:DMSO reductase [Dehalococcoidia bacterium]
MAAKRTSRRTFIKIGSAGAGMASLGAGFWTLAQAEELAPGGRTVSRTTGAPRRAVPSTCLQCPARCGILGFVEEGQLVKIEGNPKDFNNRGRLCA